MVSNATADCSCDVSANIAAAVYLEHESME